MSIISINSIKQDLEHLINIFDHPRLWLVQYYSEIKWQVDIVYGRVHSKLQEKSASIKISIDNDDYDNDNNYFDNDAACNKIAFTKRNKKIDNQLKEATEHYEQIIEKINELEKNCLEALPTDEIHDELSTVIQIKIEEIESQVYKLRFSETEIKIDEIDTLIYETLLKLQKGLMLNKGLIFLNQSVLPIENLIDSCGTLIILQDGFIGSRAIEVIK